MANSMIDLTGQRFGRWTVREMLPGYRRDSGGVSHVYCRCDCDCGTRGMIILAHSLKQGNSRSCGCLCSELASERMKRYWIEKQKTKPPIKGG